MVWGQIGEELPIFSVSRLQNSDCHSVMKEEKLWGLETLM